MLTLADGARLTGSATNLIAKGTGVIAVRTRIDTRDHKASRGWLLRVFAAAFLSLSLASLSGCGEATQRDRPGTDKPPPERPLTPPPPVNPEPPEPPGVITPEEVSDGPAADDGDTPVAPGPRPAPPPLRDPQIVIPEQSPLDDALWSELRDALLAGQLLGALAGDEPDGRLSTRLGSLVPGTTLPGRFAYGAPAVMIVDEPYFLSVTIAAPEDGETTAELDARLAQDTRETLGADTTAAIRPGDVTISSVMSADLAGAGFEITALSETRQSVDLTGGVTRWLWEVRGKTAGRASLVMRLSISGEDGAPDRVVRVIPSVIDVRSSEDAFLNQEQMAAKTPPAGADQTAGQRGARDAQSGAASLTPPSLPGNQPVQFASLAPASRCASTGAESRRLALVIGNDAYTGITRLTYARSDSVIMRDVLVESGFRVMHCEDLDADQLPAALASFRELVKSASAQGETSVAFYYSGHGASTPSQNETYLLPVSLRQATVGQIEAQGVSVGQVIGGLSNAGARRLIVIVDACRDVLRLDDGEYRGFQLLNWRTSAFDIVAYATMWGEKARDNGLYARSLAASIRALPDVDVADVLNRVQTEISNATEEDQVPQYHDRMPGVFAFRN